MIEENQPQNDANEIFGTAAHNNLTDLAQAVALATQMKQQTGTYAPEPGNRDGIEITTPDGLITVISRSGEPVNFITGNVEIKIPKRIFNLELLHSTEDDKEFFTVKAFRKFPIEPTNDGDFTLKTRTASGG